MGTFSRYKLLLIGRETDTHEKYWLKLFHILKRAVGFASEAVIVGSYQKRFSCCSSIGQCTLTRDSCDHNKNEQILQNNVDQAF